MSDCAEHVPDIQINRAILHASAAADTCKVVVIVNEIVEFVHNPLAQTLFLIYPGIVSRCMKGKQGILAGVPGAESDPFFFTVFFVSNVEAVAGGAEISACAAAQTVLCNTIPKRILKILVDLFC